MAITGIDQLIAGMQFPRFFTKAVTPTLVAGRPHSLWYLGGNPAAGSMNTVTSGGVALSSTSAQVDGQIHFTDPAAGNAYLARLQAMATQAGTLLLCDRLWHGAYQTTTSAAIVVTSTSAQTIGSVAFPARDVNGSTDGEGVYLGVEVYAATGSGTPTLTLGYTNSAGTGDRSATNITPTVATSAIGAFHFIGLQAGDTGVRSVQTITLSATWTSGNIGVVAYRPLAALELTSSNIPNAIDAVTGGMPRLFNGTVPFFVFIPNTTTASYISGTVLYNHG